MNETLTVRDAVEADVPALTDIKGAGSESNHRDRLHSAREPGFRYLVLQVGAEVLGFACLVYRRPAHWSDGADTQHLPQIVDLEVLQAARGRGYGTALIRAIERITAESGHRQLFIAVEPHDNPRAHALYLRLGYRPLQLEPYHSTWGYTDLEGTPRSGEMWIIDMVKDL